MPARTATFFFALAAAALLGGCSSGGSGSSPAALPGRGTISVEIVPNPIIARHVSGETYDFPFDVIVRETGGRAVTVTRVTATVQTAGIRLGEESWSAEMIRGLGYDTTVRAGGELRYHFEPRRSVPDDRLFGNISAELRVDAVDDGGQATVARTTVTVRR